MILFIDEAKFIKLVRTNPEEGTRQSLGRIRKSDYEITAELQDALESSEIVEINAALEIVRSGEQARAKSVVAGFPETVRMILTYYENEASVAERRWIIGALLEGLRVVRRIEREEEQTVTA